MVLLEFLPELASFNLLCSFWGSQVELFRNSTCEIDKGLVHLTAVKHFVGAVELSVSLLHEWDPKLVVIGAMAVEDGLALAVIGNSSIYDNVLPSSIFEKLEDCESILNTVINN